jgi:cupin 2 domain-containing protein
MTMSSGNIFADVADKSDDEQVAELLATENVRIDRIVSTGHASPPGFWYDQDSNEWVMLLAGSAELLVEGDAQPRRLAPGDYIYLKAHQRHRIAWTDPKQPTVWLAIHHR